MRSPKMFLVLMIVTVCGLCLPAFAVLVHQESFEAATGWSVTPAFAVGTTVGDYMDRFDNTNVTVPLATLRGNIDGTWFIGGEDTNGSGTLPADGVYTVSVDAVSVAGYNTLSVSIALNANPMDVYDTAALANGDYLRVYANIDGGGDVLIGQFTKVGASGSNGRLGQDTDLDGLGDVEIPDYNNFNNYTFAVPGGGNSMVVKVVTRFESGNEEIVYDNIRINGDEGDISPPFIVDIIVNSGSSLDIDFNEDVDQATAEDEFNYDAGNGRNPDTAVRDGSDFSIVHLTFAPALPVGDHTMTVNGVEDLNGNACVNETEDFTVTAPPTADPGDVVITEVMYDDTAGADLEWIEIYNTTGAPINISGWVVQDDNVYPADGGEGALEVPDGTTINAGQYLVLSEAALGEIDDEIVCLEVVAGYGLSNSGDNLALYTSETGGILIWGDLTCMFPDHATPGHSIELCSQSVDSLFCDADWYQSESEYGGDRYTHCTPGNGPSPCAADETPPELVSATASSVNQVDILFSELLDEQTSGTEGNYSGDNGLGTPTLAELLGDGMTVRLTFATNFSPITYTITVNNVEDLSANAILDNSEVQFTVSDVPDLVFTEVMPNPNFGGTADSLGEWFEIYNREETSVDLAGWILTDNAGQDTIEGPATIAAGDWFVFCSKPDSAANGGVPEDYAYHFGTSGWGISLNNTGETLTLRNASNFPVASLDYAGLPFAAGVSAQLRDVNDDPTVDTNWCAAIQEWDGANNGDLGTPGEQSICEVPQPPDTVTLCQIRGQDTCGVSNYLNTRVVARGIITHVDTCRGNAYIESAGCAVMIFGNATRDTMQNSTRLMEIGDSVQVNGYIIQFNGLTEFSPLFSVDPVVTFISEDNAVPSSTTISAASISTTGASCAAEVNESKLVTVQDVTFVPVEEDTFAGNTNYALTSGTDTIFFRVHACDGLVGDTIPDGLIVLTGMLGQFDNESCYCEGYQIMTGSVAPFASAECVDPAALTIYRNGMDNEVVLDWEAGLGQTCNCYRVYYATFGAAVFPDDFIFLDCVCGTTTYTDTSALQNFRIYRVTADHSCP